MKSLNRFVPDFSLLVLWAVLTLVPLSLVQADLLHRYSFDEAPGSTAGDFYSGADGTLQGGADFTGSGAVTFNGTSAFVDLPNGIISALSDATFETWITWSAGAGNWQRLFDFGNSLSGEGTADLGSNYVFLTARSSGGIARFGARAAGDTADNVNVDGPALPINVLTHVAVTYDSFNLMAKLYINGAFIAQQRATQALSSLDDVNNWLGRSQYTNDAYFNGLMHEFRIFNAALSSPQIMANAAAGPDGYAAGPGTLLGLRLSAPATIYLRGTSQARVFAEFAYATNVNVTFGEGTTYTSSDSGTVSVDANGLLRGEAAGQAEIVATYQTLSATSLVQVITVHGASLKHRYSFNESAGPTIIDSMSSSNGTLIDPGNRCVFTGSTLVLSNAASTPSSSTSGSFVDLPNGLIHVLTNATIETWVRFVPVAGNWQRAWDFGGTAVEGVPGTGLSYIFLCPRTGSGGGSRFALKNGTTETVVADAAQLPNAMAHVVVTYHPGVNTCRMYINGTLVATRTAPTPLSVINDINMWIGRAQYGSDAYFNGVFDELRIYEGTMSEGDVAVSRTAGPDTVTAGAGNLVSVTLQALPTMRGGAQVGTVLANYENMAGVNVTFSSDTSLASSDTNVIAIANGNVIVAVSPGQATVTATHAGMEGSQVITVEAIGSVATLLVNRYRFDEGAGTVISDAVGGANGTIVNPYNAMWTGTNLWLNNPANNSATNAYVNLPNGIMSRHTNASVEMWIAWAGNFTANWQRFFDFGSSAQGEDLAGTGLTYFLLTPRSGATGNRMRVAMTTNSNAGGAEQVMEPSFTMAQNVETHIVISYSSENKAMALFVNGALVAGAATQVPLYGLKDFNNWLGRAQWNDNFLNGRFNEFRIYGGCLSASQVVANYAAGPNATIELPAEILAQPANVTVGEGADATFVITARGYPAVSYQWYRDTTEIPGATTRTLTVPFVTLSDNGAQFTCVVSNLVGGSPSVATSAVATLTVVNAANSLVHRYSFTTDVSDSIGTAHGTLQNGTVISNGAAQFVAANTNYVDLPGHLIDGYPALTMEFWIEAGVNGAWARVFDFGDQNAGTGYGRYYLMFSPHSGASSARMVYSDADPGFNHEVFAEKAGILDNAGPTHVACVVDPANSTIVLYVNGVQAGIRRDFVFPLSSVVNTYSWLGRSLYNGDSWYNGGIDEFRIYSSALSAAKVWQSYRQGADVVLNNDPIAIAKQPQSVRVKAGSDVLLSVTAFGALNLGPLAYQWRFGGDNLLDQTNTSLSLTGVQAPLAGNYDVVVTNGGGDVLISFVATLTLNLPPTAVNQTAYTATNTVLSFAATNLLAGNTDPDGDTLSITATSATSTNAGTVTLVDGTVTYTPPADYAGADAFSYTVTDALGDSTTGQVIVNILAIHPGGRGVSAVPGGGVALVTFTGIPGFTYTVERTLAVPGGWVPIGTATADAGGLITFTDPNPPADQAFYRLLKQ